ncbi:MAG TPA: FAD-dependent oxidoreductase, partial [Turneriella sp.]|nr:FAD-dependent oxidoreductase [Turneriella sp.]
APAHADTTTDAFLNALGELEGVRYKWGIARGGMGAVTQALAAAAREHGVEIRTDAPVARILIEGGRAIGVRLESGEEIRAKAVATNADPKRTFLQLVGREHLDADFVHDIEHYRMGHASVRMNLALSGTPEFANIKGEAAATALQSAITLLPDRATVERCYQAARAGESHGRNAISKNRVSDNVQAIDLQEARSMAQPENLCAGARAHQLIACNRANLCRLTTLLRA